MSGSPRGCGLCAEDSLKLRRRFAVASVTELGRTLSGQSVGRNLRPSAESQKDSANPSTTYGPTWKTLPCRSGSRTRSWTASLVVLPRCLRNISGKTEGVHDALEKGAVVTAGG